MESLNDADIFNDIFLPYAHKWSPSPNQGEGGGEGACFRIFKTQMWKPVARLWMTEDTIIYSSTEDNVHQSDAAIVMFAMFR